MEGELRMVGNRNANQNGANCYCSVFTIFSFFQKIDPNLVTKTSIMLGLGETDEEVLQ